MREVKQRLLQVCKGLRLRRQAIGALLVVGILTTCQESAWTPQQLGSDNPATPGGIAHLTLDDAPGTPHLATVVTAGKVAWLYGRKTPEGQPLLVDAVVVRDTVHDHTTTMILDDSSRLLSLADASGRLDVQYGTQGVTLHLQTAQGLAFTEVLPLARLPELPAFAPLASANWRSQAAPFVLHAHVLLHHGGRTVGALRDAQVVVSTSGAEERQVARFHPDLDAHVAVLDLRDQPHDGDRAACVERIPVLRQAIARAGMGLEALAQGQPAAFRSPIGRALDGWHRAFADLGIAPSAVIKASDCQDLHQSAHPQAGTVSVTVTHPWLGTRTLQVPYDLADPMDPLNGKGKLDVTIEVDAPPRILQVHTDPATPAPGQTFRLGFRLPQPGLAVAWTLTGEDGYRQAGQAAAGPGETEAWSQPIPGGATGARNVIQAELRDPGQATAAMRWVLQVR